MKSKIRRLLLVCLLAFCLFVPTNVLGGDISTAPMMPIMPPIANMEELELLPVDPLHVHDFSWGPYYESIHRAGLGHREYYFCSANDGYTQLTGEYGDYPGCSECENPHEHSYTWGPYYESTHRAGLGHREYYFCSANDGATQVTGNYETYPGCEICFPPAHTCSPGGYYAEDEHPHYYYRSKCEDPACTNGNYGEPEYVGMTASWSWSEPGTLSGTHTASGHALTKTCSYSGCSETQTTYVAYNEDCTTCNPPHVCVSSTTHTEAAHPHRHYYYVCEDDNCPYMNHIKTEYSGTDATTWNIISEVPSNTHQQSQGHALSKICEYSGCVQIGTDYVPLPGCIICDPPATSETIKVLIDDAAYAQYNSLTSFETIMNNAEIAFNIMWNKDLIATVVQAPDDNPDTTTIDERMPYDRCSLLECNNLCDINCDNHHNSANLNLAWMDANNYIGTYDLCLAITGKSMCYNKVNVGHTVLSGMAYWGNVYLTATSYTNNATFTTRVIQHEISHTFGCLDHDGPDHLLGGEHIYYCTPGQLCIMNGGFHDNDNWDFLDIWCNNCLTRFNTTWHS